MSVRIERQSSIRVRFNSFIRVIRCTSLRVIRCTSRNYSDFYQMNYQLPMMILKRRKKPC